MDNTIERIKKRIEKEQKFDEDLWNTEANKESQIDKAIHNARNFLYRTIFSIFNEELAKEPQEYNSDLISRNMLIESFNASINTGYETFPFDIIVEVINNQPQVQQVQK